jgi:hypothetical protein
MEDRHMAKINLRDYYQMENLDFELMKFNCGFGKCGSYLTLFPLTRQTHITVKVSIDFGPTRPEV